MTLETLQEAYRIQLVPEISEELVDEIVAKIYQAGKNAAVGYIDSQFEDSRYVANGEWEKVLGEARNTN